MADVLHAVTPYGRGAGSSRVRVLEWLDRMDRSRLSSVVHTYLGHHNSSPRYLLRHPVRVAIAECQLYDIANSRPSRLLLHREASPLSRGGLEQRLFNGTDLAVYDFDDALQWDTGKGPLYRRCAPKAAKTLAAVRVADRVLAGNSLLAEWASTYNRDVRVIPSCVSLNAYDSKTDYEVRDPPRLGWIGSVSTERHLHLIAPALHEVHRRTGAKLTLVGAAGERLGSLERVIDRAPWSEQAQRHEIARFDIGLMPLYDEPYARGKCAYKLLQYLAAGTPAVASPVGANRDVLRLAGMPAPTNTDEWIEALLGLITLSGSSRLARSRRARQMVGERFSYDAWFTPWCEAVGLT